MKTVRYILAALLLMALIAVPAFAEPVPTTAFSDLTDPADPVRTIEAVTANADEIVTAVDGAIVTAAEGEEVTTTMAVTTVTATEPPTEEVTFPEELLYVHELAAGRAAKLTPLEYIEANALSLTALAAAALALVLAIVALAKNKQPGRRKMKDFF